MEEIAKLRAIYAKVLLEAGCKFERLDFVMGDDGKNDLVVNGIGDAISFDTLSRVSDVLGTRQIYIVTPGSGVVFMTIRNIGPKWSCSGCKMGFFNPWRKTCPSCQREDYWSGSVAPGTKLWSDHEIFR